jgi:hypothetical protein
LVPADATGLSPSKNPAGSGAGAFPGFAGDGARGGGGAMTPRAPPPGAEAVSEIFCVFAGRAAPDDLFTAAR